MEVGGSAELVMTATQNNAGIAPTDEKTRLVVAEDEVLLAGVLPDLLHTASSGGIEVVQICFNRSQLFRTLRKTAPDVLLCDVWMPNNSGEPHPCRVMHCRWRRLNGKVRIRRSCC